VIISKTFYSHFAHGKNIFYAVNQKLHTSSPHGKCFNNEINVYVSGSFGFHVVLGTAAVDNFICSVILATKGRITLLRKTAAVAFKYYERGPSKNGINKVFEQWLDYRINLKK
jgi:hypothetical protein